MSTAQIAAGHKVNGVKLNSPDAKAILNKYEEESSKRVRDDGLNQFIVSPLSEEYEGFYKDVWANDIAIDPGVNSITDGSRSKFLILGAGYGGLMMAARLIQVGVDANDIRLVDSAGGYGGTWWYNRYPGLMCDVESYIYMPLLEELEYMPKHKYSYGPELRKHADNIAKHFNLRDKTLFQAKVTSMTWNDSSKEWVTKIESTRKGQEGKEITTRSRFTILAGGTANHPKLPRLQDFEKYTGHTFHTARWDYSCTGGSEEKPDLVNLRGKEVAIIGTGATAIQVVPELAKWAKKVYVFQRTPSAVDVRGQRETDLAWWDREIKGKRGWQAERIKNFSAFVNNTKTQPDIDLVDDGWTKFLSYAGVTGNENGPRSPDEVQPYVEMMNSLDLGRQEKVRARVDEIVKDEETACKLKAWYPGWCKRPCFHDEYLQSFNKSNVVLVHTDGHGVDKLTEKGIYFDGKEYPVDALIFSTGYDIPIGTSPSRRNQIKATGKNGVTLDDKWAKNVATLHGIQTHGFPNFFWLGLGQTGATPNQTAMVDGLARHLAFIINEASQRHGSMSLTIEPTINAEEAWTQRISAGARVFATMGGCPPSYFNGEGDLFRMAENPEVRKNLTRGAFWAKGLNDFSRELERWRTTEPLQGFEIVPV